MLRCQCPGASVGGAPRPKPNPHPYPHTSSCQAAVMNDITTSTTLCFPPTTRPDTGTTTAPPPPPAWSSPSSSSSSTPASSSEPHRVPPRAVPLGLRTQVDVPRSGGIVEQPLNLWSVTERLAARAEQFIAESAEADRPFFVYLALMHTHVPHTPASRFRVAAEAENTKHGKGRNAGAFRLGGEAPHINAARPDAVSPRLVLALSHTLLPSPSLRTSTQYRVRGGP